MDIEQCDHDIVFHGGIKKGETMEFYAFCICYKCGALSLPDYNLMEYAINQHLNAPDVINIIKNRGFRSSMDASKSAEFDNNSEVALKLMHKNSEERDKNIDDWLQSTYELHRSIDNKSNVHIGKN